MDPPKSQAALTLEPGAAREVALRKHSPEHPIRSLLRKAGEISKERDAYGPLCREKERRRPQIAKCRALAQRAILSSSVTKKSYLKLLMAGLRQTELFEWLVGEAVSPHEKKAIGWLERSLKGSGITLKQLSNFPSRIETVAETIEKMNKRRLLAPEVLHAPNEPEFHKRSLAALVAKLPDILRLYADALQCRTKSLMRYGGAWTALAKPQERALERLAALVKKETGRPFYPELSEILIAAVQDSGSDRDDFSPDAIKMRVWRANKRRLHPERQSKH